jgi:glycosyltransferase involved in cell wall biosynthesis
MPAILAAADVVVLASWREGMPRVLMEGAAMGKPLLASDVRGNREAVTVPMGGDRVPIRSPVALARAMVAMASDPERRARAGAFNRRRALEEWDLERVIDRLERAYRSTWPRCGVAPPAGPAGAREAV